MKSVLANVAYPESEEDFNILLEQTYEQLTGVSIKEPHYSVLVERYSHGGMSSGRVAPQFWTEVGFPMLQERFRQTK